MTVIDICSGTSPAARASAFIGYNSISFDIRENQTVTATSLLAEFFTKCKGKPVSIILIVCNISNKHL